VIFIIVFIIFRAFRSHISQKTPSFISQHEDEDEDKDKDKEQYVSIKQKSAILNRNESSIIKEYQGNVQKKDKCMTSVPLFLSSFSSRREKEGQRNHGSEIIPLPMNLIKIILAKGHASPFPFVHYP